jgi:metal-responsive CopG/Arc/MetJ family transcriptional regulator
MRAHLILPDELVERVDALVGKRKRSRFVEEAVRERLRREALTAALEGTAGALSMEKHPDWATPDKAAAWVRASRHQGDERLRKVRRG